MQCTQSAYKRPIILITLHRRYHELIDNVQHIYRCRIFFKHSPIIYILWADPEISKKWILDDLKKRKLIHDIIYRETLDKVGNTSFYESINFRKALPIIFQEHGDSCFVIVHATDTRVSPVAYKIFEKQINDGFLASVFKWNNDYLEAWKTAVFAITNNKHSWPPVLSNNHGDVLESAWPKSLSYDIKNKIKVNKYSDNILFESKNTTEYLPEFEDKPQYCNDTTYLYINGYIPWYKRILNWFGVIFKRGEP